MLDIKNSFDTVSAQWHNETKDFERDESVEERGKELLNY